MKETGATASVSQNTLARGQYKDEYAAQAYKLCLLGATDRELGAFFKVAARTIGRWKKAYADFGVAIARGKQSADMEVAESLYRATVDRIVTTRQAIKCKEVYYDENGKRVEKERVEIVAVEKHIPACFRSQQFWLRNRNPKLWSLKPDEHEDDAPRAITINLGPGQNPDDDEAPA
ncbi:hypothetical protein [uncultured Flavobacterium sp.]|uniref:hypothetical protein n=1 Tax=uncultured Flavobacterium sp. TaxID=165435 RepID=UPI0025D7FDF1|nr:hypothetical protein [uncultured Flavobacterium sp.]